MPDQSAGRKDGGRRRTRSRSREQKDRDQRRYSDGRSPHRGGDQRTEHGEYDRRGYERHSRDHSRSIDRSRSPYVKQRSRRPASSDEERLSKRYREPNDDHERDSRGSDRRTGRSRSPYAKQRSRRPASSDEEKPRKRHRSPNDDYKRSKRRRSSSSHSSPPPAKPHKRSHAPLPSQQEIYNSTTSLTATDPPPGPEKQKPNFAPSGKLAAETNTVTGTTIVLKYNEPPESRKPPASQPWRLYVFKGASTLDTIELSTRSCWLFGRERSVVDFPTEHPSCSKQHAVLQFRFVEKKNEFGDREAAVRPYVIDLESANGTKVNGERVPERRYVEVRSGDVLAFGDSTREYVLMLPPAG